MSYFIKASDVFYYLDSTSDISYTLPAQLSEHPMHSRVTRSDHYRVGIPTLTISGIITDIKSAKSYDTKTSAQYLDGLQAAMYARIPLEVKYRLDKAEETNWFITSFNPTQDAQNGFGGLNQETNTVVQSFKVSMTLQQGIFLEAVTTLVDQPQAFKDVLASKSAGSVSTSTFGASAVEQKKQFTMWEKAQANLGGFATGVDPNTVLNPGAE